MKQWSEPKMWKLSASYTQVGNDGDHGDGGIFEFERGRGEGLNSGISYEDLGCPRVGNCTDPTHNH